MNDSGPKSRCGRLGISGHSPKPWEAFRQRCSSNACFTAESVDGFSTVRSLFGRMSATRNKPPGLFIGECLDFGGEALLDVAGKFGERCRVKQRPDRQIHLKYPAQFRYDPNRQERV